MMFVSVVFKGISAYLWPGIESSVRFRPSPPKFCGAEFCRVIIPSDGTKTGHSLRKDFGASDFHYVYILQSEADPARYYAMNWLPWPLIPAKFHGLEKAGPTEEKKPAIKTGANFSSLCPGI
jgi:hypothetical protein